MTWRVAHAACSRQRGMIVVEGVLLRLRSAFGHMRPCECPVVGRATHARFWPLSRSRHNGQELFYRERRLEGGLVTLQGLLQTQPLHQHCACRLRQPPGGEPKWRLKARLKAASD